MTAQEAVHLVLCAGAMAKGGEAFVLDIGKPVRICDLAQQIIEAAGYNLRDGQSPGGDIGIEYSGLCPGEKMTEELSLCGALRGTEHPKIFFAAEEMLSEIEVARVLQALRMAIAQNDEAAAREVALRWVEGYQSSKVAERPRI